MAIINPRIAHANAFSLRARSFDGTLQWGIAPIIITGVHGTGKTAVGKALARYMGFGAASGGFMHPMNPSTMDPGDVGGIPFPSQCGTFFRRLPPEFVHLANAAKRAMIIIDEFGDAPPAVQAPLQSMLNERQCGDATLAGSVRFMLFANPTEISTNGYDKSMPVANRMGHSDVTFGDEEVDAWLRWHAAGGTMQGEPTPIDADAEEARVLAAWDDADADSRARWGAFMAMKRKDGLLVIPDLGSPEASKAHVTPRTADMAGLALTGSYVHGLDDNETDEFMSMFVGKSLIKEFAAWRRENELPDFRAIVAGTEAWTHNRQRPDLTRMVLNGCVSITKTHEEAARVWDLMAAIADSEPGILATTVDVLATKPGRLGKGSESRRKVLAQFSGASRLIQQVLAESAAA